mmetsp:Transcript_35306/g.34311  ORF Transcript_35306/g.34311 Transcript_35306/m.34311 type:complete len:209 (+) Transcript_35306:301-927(+)
MLGLLFRVETAVKVVRLLFAVGLVKQLLLIQEAFHKVLQQILLIFLDLHLNYELGELEVLDDLNDIHLSIQLLLPHLEKQVFSGTLEATTGHAPELPADDILHSIHKWDPEEDVFDIFVDFFLNVLLGDSQIRDLIEFILVCSVPAGSHQVIFAVHSMADAFVLQLLVSSEENIIRVVLNLGRVQSLNINDWTGFDLSINFCGLVMSF